MNNNNERKRQGVRNTVMSMGSAVGTAILATILGFIALFISPVPMIQEFGKMLTIGVIVSFFAGIFLLVPILYMRDRNAAQDAVTAHGQKKPDRLEKRLGNLAAIMIKLKWFILIAAVAISGWGVWADLKVGVQTDFETFMPQDTKELQDIHKLRDVLGTTDQVTVLYEAKNVYDPTVSKEIDSLTENLERQYPDIIVNTKSITSILRMMNGGNLPAESELENKARSIPNNQRKLLVNEDGTKGTIVIGIKHLEAEELKDFIESIKGSLQKSQSSGLHLTVTGKSVLDVEMLSALTTGRHEMTVLGMGLVFLGLLLVYRHPIKAFVPLLPITMIVGWSGAAMYLLGLKYTPLTATLGALIIGIGTEFTILLMERFYEERRRGIGATEAMVISVSKIGKAIIASGLTVVGGFSALLVSDFLILKDFGLMTLINMSLALVSTLVVMPPLLVLLDRFVRTNQAAARNAADAIREESYAR